MLLSYRAHGEKCPKQRLKVLAEASSCTISRTEIDNVVFPIYILSEEINFITWVLVVLAALNILYGI